MRFLNDLVLNGADASTTQASIAIDGSYLIKASVQAVFTGSPAGSLILEGSNDNAPYTGYQAALFVPTNWSTIPNTSQSVAASGIFLIPAIDICYQYIRIVYTPTGGTGTVTARLKTLGF